MLPLQITLEGFLSYREPTTISFEGASLWMLAGENGAGKSSVFDAMRWTLFGAHRGGKSGHEALIHHGQSRLRVAFDLGLGESRFRLIRTLARVGRATWQIEEVFGDDTLKVPETDMREGYEKWVRERIGLSDETFCTAMYLAQNRGDAILGANSQQRYEMLAEIVDISAYAALHERAKTRASELESASKAAERSWQLAPGADPEIIAETREKIAVLSAQIEANRARREKLLGLEPLAAGWQKVEAERAEVQNELEAARNLLGDAAQIERDCARLAALETLLPPLGRYAQARARAAQNARERDAAAAKLQLASAQNAALESDATALQARLQPLESAQQRAEKARLEFLGESASLAPRAALARQISAYKEEIAALETRLRAFPTDLSGQKTGMETRIADAQEAAAARAILGRFAREKTAWQEAKSGEIAALNAGRNLRAELSALEAETQKRRVALEAARETQTRAIEALAAAKTRARDAREARERIESVQEQSDCFYCGQKLTPQHRQKELARLDRAAELCQEQERSAQNSFKAAADSEKDAQISFETAQKSARERANSLEKANQEARQAQNAAANASARAGEIFEELSAKWQAHFEGASSEGAAEFGAGLTPSSNHRGVGTVEGLEEGVSPALPPELPIAKSQEVQNGFARAQLALVSDFPLAADLETPPREAQTMRDWRAELSRLTKLESEQRDVAARLGDRQNQLAPLREMARDEDLPALLAREVEVKVALDAALRSLETGRAPLQSAREAASRVAGEIAAAREAMGAAQLQGAALDAARIEIERALADSQSAATAPFQKLSDDELRAETEALQGEFVSLSRGDLAAQAAKMRAAQGRVQKLEEEIARLERALESVPPEARRAPQELRTEAAALGVALESEGQAQKALQLELHRLEAQRDDKTRLESAHFEAQNRAREHRTLADLLGPHELQRFLLREAETGIIDEANAVLDRISGGSLRLDLRADDEEIAGARKGVPKVLDVAIFRGDETEGRGQGMLPAFLSGSQRFRVAVSLALGIGRYATRGGGSRLEAVIIDEGFGALDKIGRGEMIDELQALGQELKRVILVSHQEEFFEAFPNRYWIEKRAGASTAQLMAG